MQLQDDNQVDPNQPEPSQQSQNDQTSGQQTAHAGGNVLDPPVQYVQPSGGTADQQILEQAKFDRRAQDKHANQHQPQPSKHAANYATSIPMPGQAEDNDLIEKEWVEKAKHIVQKTDMNPYHQQKELAKMKADYLKKRYNKDIKIQGD